MTRSTHSADGQARPRLRRTLVAAVAAGACAMPLALAPAASAQTGGNPVGGIEITLLQTITSLPNTLTNPLAGSSGDRPPGNDACVDPALVSPLLTCVIDSVANLLGGQSATGAKATVKKKVRGVRKQSRMSRKISR
jgi:hypothetical protein